MTPYRENGHEKVPLLPKSANKDTLFSDLLRSEPHFEKGTLFWEFLDKHVKDTW